MVTSNIKATFPTTIENIWALREIGKINYEYNEKALLLAYELLETENKTQVWIAKDVIKELENVTKTEGRKRLISTNSKMGQNL